MNTLLKKSIGTLAAIAIILGAVAFTLPTDARAQFINTVFGLVVDGVVLGIDNDSITVGTAGADPIEMVINDHTRFVGTNVSVGDSVMVTARVRNSEVLARVIRRTGDGGSYGNVGDRVIVSRAKVVSVGSDSFVVESSAATIKFEVTPKTRFFRTALASLEVGDTLLVVGEESGSSFVARHVLER